MFKTSSTGKASIHLGQVLCAFQSRLGEMVTPSIPAMTGPDVKEAATALGKKSYIPRSRRNTDLVVLARGAAAMQSCLWTVPAERRDMLYT